jgi:hypothetical protein
MGLKFLARAGHMATFAAGNAFGQLPRYIGRTFKPSPKGSGSVGAFVADAEPTEVPEVGPDAEHLTRMARKGGVWAADKATADACGVEFVELKKDDDGEWIAAPKSAPAPVAAPSPDLASAGSSKSKPKAEG